MLTCSLDHISTGLLVQLLVAFLSWPDPDPGDTGLARAAEWKLELVRNSGGITPSWLGSATSGLKNILWERKNNKGWTYLCGCGHG